MAEVKFTNGKWEVVEASEHHGFYVEDSNGYTVADLYFMSKLSGARVDHGDNAKANAHLIASAPEMYEMLRALSEMSSEDAKLYLEGSSDVIDLLAKARGE
jgi:hypothetical protein